MDPARRPKPARRVFLFTCRMWFLGLHGEHTADGDCWIFARYPIADDALRLASKFLTEQQDEDGSWRSRTYGILRDDLSLTPFVLTALHNMPEDGGARPKASENRALFRGLVEPRGVRVLRPQRRGARCGLVHQVVASPFAVSLSDRLNPTFIAAPVPRLRLVKLNTVVDDAMPPHPA